MKVQQRNNINRGGQKQLSENVEVATEVCGETLGHRRIQRETWWWNEALKSTVQEGKRAYKVWWSASQLFN